MKRTLWLQENRLMSFEEAYEEWAGKRLSQEEEAVLLGVCSRTFRRFFQSSQSSEFISKREPST